MRSHHHSSSRPFSVVVVILLILALIGIPASRANAAASGYIVQAGSASQAVALVKACGGNITSELAVIHGAGARLSAAAAGCVSRQPGATLTRDAGVRLTTTDKAPTALGRSNKIPATDYPDVTGADVVWQQGVYGQGVAVAVLDTGMDLDNRVLRGPDGKPAKRLLAWVDYIDRSRKPQDPNGHGSHIAGIIANAQPGEDGEYNGMAPGVNLVGVRVLNDEGYGTYEQVIQGIQWVINHREQYNIRVMNLSLVSFAQSPYWADPLNQAVSQAWAQGITVVSAAGNTGPGAMTIGVPGNNPYIITVGAFTDNYTPLDWSDDYLAPFSAAGPTLDGFVKPDVLAPGAHMVSTIPANSQVAHENTSASLNGNYYAMAGTSQAAAVVSGIAALVLARHPGLTPDQVKYRLMITAFPWLDLENDAALYSMWQQGAGRVNAVDAVFGAADGSANSGLNIRADLAGGQHYQGYSYYDAASGSFRLYGDFNAWEAGYGAWSGGYGAWSGGYGAWSGGYGAWSGGYGAWSGGYGAWSGGYGAWSGGYGAWSGGYGAWSGGYGAWSGGYGAWSGSEPWAGLLLADPSFVESFTSGVSPDISQTAAYIENWIDPTGPLTPLFK